MPSASPTPTRARPPVIQTELRSAPSPAGPRCPQQSRAPERHAPRGAYPPSSQLRAPTLPRRLSPTTQLDNRGSIHDVEVSTPTELGGSSRQDRPHALSGAALFADDFSNVTLGHPQLDQRVLISVNLADFDPVRIVD